MQDLIFRKHKFSLSFNVNKKCREAIPACPGSEVSPAFCNPRARRDLHATGSIPVAAESTSPGRRSVRQPLTGPFLTPGHPPVPRRFTPLVFSPRYCFSEMASVCAVVGGILAQEIVKVKVTAEQQEGEPRTAGPACRLRPTRPHFMPHPLPSSPLSSPSPLQPSRWAFRR